MGRAGRMNRIAVLGAGSWGTALAIQFARAGQPTILWGIEVDEIRSMALERCNTAYLPKAAFPDGLEVTTRLEEALRDAEDVLIAVPSHAFRETLQRIEDAGTAPKHLAWATKGFETASGLLPHQVAAQMLDPRVPTAVISGPTFAAEVAAGLPSAVTIASADERNARRLAKAVSTDAFRAYTARDIIGVEVGGATKNVLAIGAGISDGLGFGANTRVAMVTRGLMEMTRLGLALGAQKETFMGLSGIGDLVLTCTDNQSRNRRFGLKLAQGATVEASREAIGQVVEGYYAADAVVRVAARLNVELPIIEQIYRIIYQSESPREAVATLMRRPLSAE